MYIVACMFLIAPVTSANANIIINPIGASTTITTIGSSYSINNIWNQSGLSTNYATGDDFDTYINSNPSHSYYASGNEWISSPNAITGDIILDLGKIYNIDKLALWNEDYQGIHDFTISTSTDGVNYVQIGGTLTANQNNIGWDYATNPPVPPDYLAQVFSLASTTLAQFVEIHIIDAYSRTGAYFSNVGVGEVAFSGTTVPEPMTMLLFATGIIGLAGFRKRK